MHVAMRVILSVDRDWTWCEVFCKDDVTGKLVMHRKAFPAPLSLQTIMQEHFSDYASWEEAVDEWCGPVLPPPAVTAHSPPKAKREARTETPTDRQTPTLPQV